MKKISAFLLAVLMVAALLPVMSFAADPAQVSTAQELKDNLAQGNSVLLTQDLELDGGWSCTLAEGAVLDGGGHTILFNVDGRANQNFKGTNFTIKNLVINNEATERPLAISMNGGTLENVTIKGNYNMGVNVSGVVTVTECTFDNNGGAGWGLYADDDVASQMTVSDSIFKSPRAAMLKGSDSFTGNTVESTKGVSVNTATATISGNTFTGDRSLSISKAGSEITENNFYGKVEAGVAVTLEGNYWDAAALEASDAKVNAANNLSTPVGSEPAPAPAYAGPAMNWVKVNAADNGVVKSGPLAASAGATITLYPKAAEGYVLDTVSVLDAEGNAVALDGLKFAIPAGGVTVSATFKLAE